MTSDGAIATLAVTVLFLAFIVYSQNRGVARLRKARDLLQMRLDAVALDRDGWRDVAQRALLVAQIGRGVNERAARIAETVVSKT